MFQPRFQGDAHPGIGQVDELMQAALTTLGILQRASKADKAKYRAKFRGQLVDIAERGMRLADELCR
jgi:hypothetical protein